MRPYQMPSEQRNQVVNNFMYFINRVLQKEEPSLTEIAAMIEIAECMLAYCIETREMICENLITYVKRVSQKENAALAEIAALPKVAKLLIPCV